MKIFAYTPVPSPFPRSAKQKIAQVPNEKSGYYPLINQDKTIMKLEVKKHFRHSIELLIHRSSYATLKVFFF